MRRQAVGFLVALFFASCGVEPAGVPPASGGPDDTVSSTPGDEEPRDSGPQRVAPRDGLVDARPISWDRVRVIDDTTIDLFYYSGIEECYGVDHVEVDYSKKAVTVTIYEGRVPEAEVCIELAVRKVLRVALDDPLDGRNVKDGA